MLRQFSLSLKMATRSSFQKQSLVLPSYKVPFLLNSKSIYSTLFFSYTQTAQPSVTSFSSLKGINSPLMTQYSQHVSNGVQHLSKSDTKTAQRSFQKAYNLSVDLFGKESTNAVICITYLAQVCQLEGNIKKSLKLYDQSLKILSKSSDSSFVLLADIHSNMSKAHQTADDLPKALHHSQIAIQLLSQNCPDDYQRITLAFQTIGNTYALMGDFSEAKSYLFKALEVLKENKETHDSELGSLYDKIAGLLDKEGKTDEALKYRKMALTINRKSSASSDDFSMFNQYLNLSANHAKLGEDEKSLSYLEEAYNLLEKNYKNKENPHRVPLMIKMGQLYLKVKNIAKAVSTLESALKMLEGAAFKDKRMVDIARKILNYAYSQKNELEKVMNTLRTSSNVLMESSMAYTDLHAQAYKNLGLEYMKSYDVEKARGSFIRALQIVTSMKGPDCKDYKELKMLLKEL